MIEHVVVLHGFAAPASVMLPLKWSLQRAGYDASLWVYPCLSEPVSKVAEKFRDQLIQLSATPQPFHIVAHSMGALVTRVALEDLRLMNLGRVVFITPPMLGTPVARLTPNWMKRIMPPLYDLSDAPDSLVHRLPDWSAEIECATLASTLDLLVPLANTHMRGEREHLALMGTHNSLLFSPRAFRFIVNFLRSGDFDRPIHRA